MNVIQAPDWPWTALHFACTNCGGIVQFAGSDLGGTHRIKPKRGRDGTWRVLAQCPCCRLMSDFQEAGAAGSEAGDSGFERSAPDADSLPPAPAEDAA